MGLCIYAFLYLHKYVDLPEKRIFLLLFVCAGLMGVLLGEHETRRVEKLEEYISSKKYIEVEGVVDEVNRTEKGYRILLKETKEKRNLGGAYLYVDEMCADIGDRVSAKGEVSLLREAKNEGAYDERRKVKISWPSRDLLCDVWTEDKSVESACFFRGKISAWAKGEIDCRVSGGASW